MRFATPTTPNVAVQVWYDVGSKDDPKDRSGFAHMFEHLMFKATRNLVSEQMDRLTEDVGGYNNASTNDDYTNYYELVPANHLQRLLFAEADRMASLVVEPKSFASERDVVKEELRQSTLARPYGKLFSTYLSAASYTKSPYARSTIGSIDNLEAASIDDVRAFHATYYRPDNAILVIAGNFDPATLDTWVDQYFATIARPSTPIPRVTAIEPERTKAVTYTVYEPNTPLPAVLKTWHVPADNSPDIPALTVLQTILATGESSRLYEHLIYRDQLAQDASAFLDSKKGTGNLVVYAILANGKTAEAGDAALSREIARLRDLPVTAVELAEAKNEILTAAITSRETAEGRARILASSVIIDGDPHAADKQLAAIAAITPTDVQRVARAYLNDDQSATIRYLPADAKPAGATSTPITIAASVVTEALTPPADIAIVTPATEATRILPPQPGTPVATTLPEPVTMTLANGLRVIAVERHDLPLVTAALVATGGGATDPTDRAGLSNLATDLLTKGTTTRSATEIARQMESLGASIDTGTDRDGASVSVTVKSDQLTAALPILADVAMHPAFAPEEIERARAQAIDGVTVAMKDPAQLAAMVANRAVFGTGPYAAPLSGTPESLKAIARPDLVRSYQQTWECAAGRADSRRRCHARGGQGVGRGAVRRLDARCDDRARAKIRRLRRAARHRRRHARRRTGRRCRRASEHRTQRFALLSAECCEYRARWRLFFEAQSGNPHQTRAGLWRGEQSSGAPPARHPRRANANEERDRARSRRADRTADGGDGHRARPDCRA